MHPNSLIARSLTWRYLIALTLVAMLTTAAWLSLHLVISEQKSNAAVVNVSGRQRMLSQRTALFSSLLVHAPAAGRPAIRTQLREAADLMQRSHRGLIRGDAALDLPGKLSERVHAMYFDAPLGLDRQVETYLSTVQALLMVPDAELQPEHPLFRYIITVSPARLVSSLDQMVSQYQSEGEAAVRRLQTAETLVWLVTLLLLVMEALFIFRPFARQIGIVLTKLHGVTERLRQSQDELEERVRQRTREVEQKSMQLTESEEKFRAISTAAHDAILIIDQNEAITYWNPAATAMFDYASEQALGRNLHDLLAPARHREDIRRGFAKFRSTNCGPMIGKTIEATALHGDGHEFPIELSISTLPLNGQIYALGMIRDISGRKQAERTLAQFNRDFENFLAQTTDFVYFKDADSRLRFCSQTLARITGHASWRDMIGKHDREIFPSDTAHIYEEEEHPIFAEGKPLLNKIDPYYDAEGRLGYVQTSKWPLFDEHGSVTGIFGISRDITDQKRNETKLQLAASVFTHAREGIMITDGGGIIVEVNDTFTRITGYRRDEVLGRNPRMLKSGRQPHEYYTAMWQTLTEQGYWCGEIWNRRKNGEVYAELLTVSAVRNAGGATENFVALFTDITPIKDHQRQLEQIAHYDALTGLPNRVLLADRLQHALAQSQRRRQSLAVVYLDLDGFKAVNDIHGHDAGDELLITVGQRMKGALREGDTLARIGGDEFVAVLVDLESAHDWEPVLGRLLQAAADPVTVGSVLLHVSASIGVTLYPQDSGDADLLMRHADQAMYQAKQAGKNRCHLFELGK